MHKKTVALIAAALLLPASQAQAQEDVQRVELAGSGFAFSPPAGWAVLGQPSEAASQLEATVGAAEFEGLMAQAESGYVDLLSVSVDGTQACSATASPVEGFDFDTYVSVFWSEVQGDLYTETIEEPVEVALPMRRSVSFDTELGPAPIAPATNYVLDGGAVVLGVACVADERPDDAWLSVVAGFEFLPFVGD